MFFLRKSVYLDSLLTVGSLVFSFFYESIAAWKHEM